MKLVWCPDLASKAYIDGVRVIADQQDDLGGPSEVAELVSAMAGGWNAQLIVEAPDVRRSGPAATSLALAAAARRTGGRYACVLPDAVSAAAYGGATLFQPVVGDADEAMARLEGVDLLVVDARRRDAAAVLRAARPGPRGMVVGAPRRRKAAWRRRRGHGRRHARRAVRLPAHREGRRRGAPRRRREGAQPADAGRRGPLDPTRQPRHGRGTRIPAAVVGPAQHWISCTRPGRPTGSRWIYPSQQEAVCMQLAFLVIARCI
ncbi:hypothetical protein PR202_gb08430 [Eleusine coracana subsp. coracana]|uniref:Uncharacterized protein n=1 Tax=Eleusine coracana subsp. coracana TaxID=191504 RepID=A0AAV5EEW0_ELECO|nr:hypothetical protein PR202_gb08430 [Eleusine coracana subsp. coracana]